MLTYMNKAEAKMVGGGVGGNYITGSPIYIMSK